MSTLDKIYNMSVLDPINVLQPKHILSNQDKIIGNEWYNITRIDCDKDTTTKTETTSQLPGVYQLSGFDPSHHTIDNIIGNANFQKVYRNNQNYIDEENRIMFPESSNLRNINQLYTRPYVGFFCGAGMRAIGHKDTESALHQGVLTNLRDKSCQTATMKTIHRFTPLPDYGNPQKIEHIIQPSPRQGGWVRGGIHTRDYVRQIDYQKRCLDSTNNKIIHKK